jgi:thiosulfate/3-mercaptopyruvate sulfurtransferase
MSTARTRTQTQRGAGAHTDGHHGLVDPDWIAAHLDDPAVRLVELDVSATAYEAGHIPGAVLWNAYADLRRPDYSIVGSAEIAHLLSGSGIDPSSTIVVYGYAAHLGYWLMKRHGHEQVRLMDGLRERWTEAGFEWSSHLPPACGSEYGLPPENADLVVSRGSLADAIADPDSVIVDVRSRPEFDGEAFWPSGIAEGAGRAGHVPGATHFPVDLVRGEDGRLRGIDELQPQFEASAIVPDRRVITYCTIGNRASQVWFALKNLLGYPRASVYYGSWVDWGKAADTPIENQAASSS